MIITSNRVIAGRSWHGQQGTVYSVFLRGTIPDWVILRVTTAGQSIDISLRPDEIEPVSS